MKHLLAFVIIFFFGCDNLEKPPTTEENIYTAIVKYYEGRISETNPTNSLDTVIIADWDTLSDLAQAKFDVAHIAAHCKSEFEICELKKRQIINNYQINKLAGSNLLDVDTIELSARLYETKRLVNKAINIEDSYPTLDSVNFLGFYATMTIKLSDFKGVQVSKIVMMRLTPEFKIIEKDYKKRLGIKLFD